MIHAVESYVLLNDEYIVDLGIGTTEDIAEAAARIKVRRAAALARWRALPLYVRFARRLAPRLYEARYRVGHAIAALRGIECEG